MNSEAIINELEKTIKKVCEDVRKKKGAVGGDKLDSLSKVVNAYSRLLERHNNKTCSDNGTDGNQEYIEAMNG